MSAEIIDGKAIASAIREKIKKEVSQLDEKPGLAVVLVGENPASKVYVGIKKKTCEEVGIRFDEHKLAEKTEENELIRLIRKLNADKKTNAILVQMPLPAHLNTEKVLGEIALEKDADGFHLVNIGKLVSGNEATVPCTPNGIIRLLEETRTNMEGANAVIVGRSNVVGKPAAMMLLNRNATVTICHSRTKNIAEITKRADILIAAAGKPGMITADMIKEGAVVIDVGISKVNGNIVGDVDFESCLKKAGKITPVPGGVGPMTVAMLLENTLKLYRRQK